VPIVAHIDACRASLRLAVFGLGGKTAAIPLPQPANVRRFGPDQAEEAARIALRKDEAHRHNRIERRHRPIEIANRKARVAPQAQRILRGIVLASQTMAVVDQRGLVDRKSTRLNSSHVKISYAVFCLKKKNPNKSISNTHSEQI